MRALSRGLLALACAIAPGMGADGMVRIETGDPLYLVEPGQEERAVVVVANTGDGAASVRLQGTVSELDGRSSPFVHELAVAAHGEVRVPLPLGERRLGIRYVDYELSGGAKPERGRQSLLYARPFHAMPDPAGFLYGVASHPERGSNSDRDRELEMIACGRAGLRVMRMDATWSSIEPKRGEWNFTTYDRLVELAAANGVELELILAYGVQHAAAPATVAAYEKAKAAGDAAAWKVFFSGPPLDQPWRTYVATTTQRYRGKVRLWEVWNEPDLAGFFAGSTDDYIRMLRSAHAEVKRSDPANLVLSGGFATVNEHGGRALNPDLQERVLKEASDAFDIHAYHGHGTFAHFRPAVEGGLARIRAAMPDQRPLYFNETALSSTQAGEIAQAWALVKKLAYVRSRGAVGYTWYDLRNDGWDAADHEHNYGMLQRDFHPKAVYAASVELNRRMHGTTCTGTLDLGPGRFAWAFGSPDHRLAVLWNEEAGLGDEPIAVRVPDASGPVQAVDIMGNASELPVHDGVVLLRPQAAPTYLAIPRRRRHAHRRRPADRLRRRSDGRTRRAPAADRAPCQSPVRPDRHRPVVAFRRRAGRPALHAAGRRSCRGRGRGALPGRRQLVEAGRAGHALQRRWHGLERLGHRAHPHRAAHPGRRRRTPCRLHRRPARAGGELLRGGSGAAAERLEGAGRLLGRHLAGAQRGPAAHPGRGARRHPPPGWSGSRQLARRWRPIRTAGPRPERLLGDRRRTRG